MQRASADETVDYKELLSDLQHEVRTINAAIKCSAEVLGDAIQGERLDVPAIQHHCQEILESSYLLSFWLDVATYESNPDVFAQEDTEQRCIYGIFSKATRPFRRISTKRKVKIIPKGESYAQIETYRVVEILPYILLDNAVKYSPSSGRIFTEFEERSNDVQVTISSVGPVNSSEEISRICERQFRSRAAIESGVQGSGRGLALAKKICDLHGATIAFESSGTPTSLNGVLYAPFQVKLTFARS